MSEAPIFKRKVENFGNPIEEDVRTMVLEEMAHATVAEKKAFIAGLPEDVRKSMRNSFLLAQATRDIPSADDGIFQRALRRRISL